MQKKLNTQWLKDSLSYRYGYRYSESEWDDFSFKLLSERKTTKKRIKEVFNEDQPVILENLYISSNIVDSIVTVLEKYYKKYFSNDAFKKLIFSAILQYEKLHCCVLRSDGNNSVFKMAGTKNISIPFKLVIICQSGQVQLSTDRFSPPIPCLI